MPDYGTLLFLRAPTLASSFCMGAWSVRARSPHLQLWASHRCKCLDQPCNRSDEQRFDVEPVDRSASRLGRAEELRRKRKKDDAEEPETHPPDQHRVVRLQAFEGNVLRPPESDARSLGRFSAKKCPSPVAPMLLAESTSGRISRVMAIRTTASLKLTSRRILLRCACVPSFQPSQVGDCSANSRSAPASRPAWSETRPAQRPTVVWPRQLSSTRPDPPRESPS